jgi:hypothetical protein
MIAMKLVVYLDTAFFKSQFGSRKYKSANNEVAATIHSIVGCLNCDMTSSCIELYDAFASTSKICFLIIYHNGDTQNVI